MTDKADIQSSSAELSQAIDGLEAALAPILSRLRTLEAQANDTDSFREDRAKLAAELDRVSAEAQTAAEQFSTREAEFNRLGRETEQELARTINLVQSVVGGA